MKKFTLLFTLLSICLSAQSNETPTINLDSISIHYSKDAFKSYRDSLDTYLSRLDKKATQRVYFKLKHIGDKDTVDVSGIMYLNKRLKINKVDYNSSDNLDNTKKEKIEEDFKGILKLINDVYKLSFYRFHGKHFGCEYSGGKIWKFLVADKTRKHFRSALKGVLKYSFGVELNKNRISFIKTKLEGFEDAPKATQEMFINFKPKKERKIYLTDAEIIYIEPKKKMKYHLLLDFKSNLK